MRHRFVRATEQRWCSVEPQTRPGKSRTDENRATAAANRQVNDPHSGSFVENLRPQPCFVGTRHSFPNTDGSVRRRHPPWLQRRFSAGILQSSLVRNANGDSTRHESPSAMHAEKTAITTLTSSLQASWHRRYCRSLQHRRSSSVPDNRNAATQLPVAAAIESPPAARPERSKILFELRTFEPSSKKKIFREVRPDRRMIRHRRPNPQIKIANVSDSGRKFAAAGNPEHAEHAERTDQ